MATIAISLKDLLAPIFETDDPIFKSVVADTTLPPEVIVTNPNQYNAGAIGNQIEYLRRLGLFYLTQLLLENAEGKFLDYMAFELIGIVRYTGENDADFIARLQKFILAPKVSPASIIMCLRPFSNSEPIIIEGLQDTAFADVTYSDNYRVFKVVTPGPEFDFFVQPAISAGPGDGGFFFLVTLDGTNQADIFKVLDILNRWIAAGVIYEVEIV